ncbi:MAG: phosphatidate cytidylyltransferase [Planctomycetota bacterium]|nr:phosphatidate cytidylyltransferase [Planctomycetota bacterium]
MNLDHLHPHLIWTLGGIYGFLIFATVFVFLMGIKNPEKDNKELVDRIKTCWIIVTVYTLVTCLQRGISLVFFAFLSFLALKEYLSIIPTRRADRRVLFWAYLAIPLQYLWAGIEWYGMFIIFIPVYMFLFLPFRMLMAGESRGFLAAIGTLHWGLMTTVFSLSHLAFLFVLPDEGNPNGGGAALALFLVMLTQLNDVFQYISGKLFGKNPISPHISPNKTREGLIGGVLMTTLLATLLAPWLTPLGFVESLGAGLLLSLAGFIGDLSVSALKRDLGRKDAGNLLPGHGGILDRVDSLSYTAPLFFHYVRYLCF